MLLVENAFGERIILFDEYNIDIESSKDLDDVYVRLIENYYRKQFLITEIKSLNNIEVIQNKYYNPE